MSVPMVYLIDNYWSCQACCSEDMIHGGKRDDLEGMERQPLSVSQTN
jgi:hypothetical protein